MDNFSALETYLSGIYEDEYLAMEGDMITHDCIATESVADNIKSLVERFCSWVRKLIERVKIRVRQFVGWIKLKAAKLRNTGDLVIPEEVNAISSECMEYFYRDVIRNALQYCNKVRAECMNYLYCLSGSKILETNTNSDEEAEKWLVDVQAKCKEYSERLEDIMKTAPSEKKFVRWTSSVTMPMVLDELQDVMRDVEKFTKDCGPLMDPREFPDEDPETVSKVIAAAKQSLTKFNTIIIACTACSSVCNQIMDFVKGINA